MSIEAKSKARRKLAAFVTDLRLEEDGEHAFKTSARIREDCALFRGHFPENPVLPGAFHVWIAYLILWERLGGAPRLASVEKGRFRIPLLPRDAFTMSIRLAREQGRIAARCKVLKEGKEASRFNITLEYE
jgi:3-hydroxymyristoyl/3-hydroxydecanoyl-(acyl carrier protein) dehydratase